MKQSRIGILFRLVKLVKPLVGFMIFAVLMGVLGFLCAQFIPILGGFALLEGLQIKKPFSYQSLLWILPLLALFRSIFRLLEQRTNHYIAITLLAIVRDKVFQALRRLSPAKLEGKDSGDLISLITTDVELLEVFYAHTISPIFIALITESIMCLFIGSYHWLLGVVAAISFLVIGVLVPMNISKRSDSLGDELRENTAQLAAYMLENIRGLDETLQYQVGNKRLQTMNQKTDDLTKLQEQYNQLSGINLSITNTCILVFDVLMLLIAITLFQRGLINIEGVIVPVIAFMSSFGPVSALAALGTTLQATIASGSRVLAIIDEVPQTLDIEGKVDEPFEQACLRNVSFGYQTEDVLKDVSVDFNQNQIIGVRGKSGSGKSTILKLLMRFWEVKQGEVCINHTNINNVNTKHLRDIESYMTQDTHLFQDTIANNIRIAKLDASDEEVIEACKKASLHEYIQSLPNGYETRVGEFGDTLSAGERQRVSLARVFLHDADFILLDEPTSNLDSLNEAIILKSLKEQVSNKTIALVTHRASTMRIADQTYSMEDGSLI